MSGPHGVADAPSAPVQVPADRLQAMIARARPMGAEQAATSTANGTVVKVTGTAAPGPGGPLRAPMSGRPCVWYRSVVIQAARPRGVYSPGIASMPLNELTPSDVRSIPTGPRRGIGGQRYGSDRSSVTPFGIAEGPAVLAVDPRSADIDSDVLALNRVVRPKDRSRRDARKLRAEEVHVEWIVPVGALLLAFGTVVGDRLNGVWLVVQDPGVVLVTTRSEQQILSRMQASTEGPRLPFRRRRRER